jgi:hypothetical protein
MHEIQLEYINDQENNNNDSESDDEEKGEELPIHRQFSSSSIAPILDKPISEQVAECFLKYNVRWSSLFSTKDDLWRSSQLFHQHDNEEKQENKEEENENLGSREKSIAK